MADKPMIKESLVALDFCGLKPTNQTAWTKIKVIFQAALYIYVVTELALRLAVKWDDQESVDGVLELGMVYQVFGRVAVIFAYRQTMAELLVRVEKFWSLDHQDDQFRQELRRIMILAERVAKCFLVIFFTCCSLYVLRPIFTSTRILPYATYHPVDRHKSPDYELTFFIHIVIMVEAVPFIMGFDGLFFSLVIYLVCQFKMIRKAFLDMSTKTRPEESCLEEIKILVDHHNLVCECIKDMTTVYSSMLLNQFLSSLVCICTGLLSLISLGFPPELGRFSTYVAFMAAVLSQLFIYCSAGNYLASEAESVSEAVYCSDWWVKTQPKIRRAYVLVIQRANKMERLSAGGMFPLDLESFTEILRASLSFFTLVQALYTRTE